MEEEVVETGVEAAVVVDEEEAPVRMAVSYCPSRYAAATN